MDNRSDFANFTLRNATRRIELDISSTWAFTGRAVNASLGIFGNYCLMLAVYRDDRSSSGVRLLILNFAMCAFCFSQKARPEFWFTYQPITLMPVVALS
ncbi:hypothetical protein RvY_16372 [Ramazzottius varieornatus]|uniref:7TM GPCR serpentine receptor class x (Srx) domain-containing protein n=1 Tax=Ramazzottius varieornatus TaxID=947166 RepID=A0A1D1W114_RAMVA|nr:hypothetical protein RvY_16372 [Ramazzottius varieornatus]